MEEAKVLAMSILKKVMEEDVTPTNVEVATIDVASGLFRVASADEIQALIAASTRTEDQQ